MPIIEHPIPPIPAERREPLVVPFEPEWPEAQKANYPNALYQLVHQVASGERKDVTATVVRDEARRERFLVLLDRPILGVSLASKYTCTFCAALLHQDHRGYIDGWLISTHEAALTVWNG